MIGTIKIQLNAAHPNMALPPLYAFVGSPSNLRIIDAPKKIGSWQITEVYVSYNYPDNTQQTLPCTLVGGAYVCTLPASTAVGTSGLGYSVTANGTDENGNAVQGYVLGKGDIVILDSEAAISTGAKANYVNLLSAQREVPEDGDMWQTADGGYVIWQDGEVHELNVPFEAISAYVESQVSSKAEADWVQSALNNVSSELSAKASKAEVAAELSVKADKSFVESISSEITLSVGTVAADVSKKADESELSDYAAISSLNSYYTKSETSSATEIQTAFDAKADASALAEISATADGKRDLGDLSVYRKAGVGETWTLVATQSGYEGTTTTVMGVFDDGGDPTTQVWKFYIDGENVAGSYGEVDADSCEVQWTGGEEVGYSGIARRPFVYQPMMDDSLAKTSQLSNKADTSALTAYATADSLSSYYTKSETSSATEIQSVVDAKADISSVPTKTTDLSNDSGYITSVDVNVPAPTSYWGGKGWAQKSLTAQYLINVTGFATPVDNLKTIILYDGQPLVQTLEYSSWALTKWYDYEYDTPLNLEGPKYVDTLSWRVGARPVKAYVGSYCWIYSGGSYFYVLKAEETANGGFQPTSIARVSSASPTWLDVTLNEGQYSIETVGGETSQVVCTRDYVNPRSSVRNIAYEDDVSSMISASLSGVVDDVQQLSSSTSSLSTAVSAVSADVSNLNTAVSQLSTRTDGEAFPLAMRVAPDSNGTVNLSSMLVKAVNGVAFCTVNTSSTFRISDNNGTWFYYNGQASIDNIDITPAENEPIFRVTYTLAYDGDMPLSYMCFIELMGYSHL